MQRIHLVQPAPPRLSLDEMERNFDAVLSISRAEFDRCLQEVARILQEEEAN